jgi:hypothetical protein
MSCRFQHPLAGMVMTTASTFAMAFRSVLEIRVCASRALSYLRRLLLLHYN